jgi:predicted solute-binding protein
MESILLQKLAEKSITKEQLAKKVRLNPNLIPEIISGISSAKPAIRYGCGKILMDVSTEHPDRLYPYLEFFRDMLDSKYRILTWNAICIIANLTKVDTENKFDVMFDKYYRLLNNEYMVTVANVVGNSGKIAVAKPQLSEQIVEKLLTVEEISTTPHLSAECKRVITEHAIKAFDEFFPQIQQKEKVTAFVKKHLKSSRKSLRTAADDFLKKWDHQDEFS